MCSAFRAILVDDIKATSTNDWRVVSWSVHIGAERLVKLASKSRRTQKLSYLVASVALGMMFHSIRFKLAVQMPQNTPRSYECVYETAALHRTRRSLIPAVVALPQIFVPQNEFT